MIDQTSRIFDETVKTWSNDVEVNRMFIITVQNFQNHILAQRGHLLLNDIYEALGFEPSAPGSVLGWSQQVNNDSFIVIKTELIGVSGRFKVDFNVDGIVFHKLGRKP